MPDQTAAIPVREARRIGEEYRKSWVVLIACDDAGFRTATWGREPEHKEQAADFADAIFADLPKITHEDYRHLDAGEQAQRVDTLLQAIKAADKAIEAVLVQRRGGWPIHNNELELLRANLQEAVKST